MSYLSYNGFSDFRDIRVDQFHHLTEAGPEKAGRGITRHLLEGSANVIFTPPSGSESMGTKIAELTARLNRPAQALVWKITGLGDGGDTTMVDIAANGDDMSGPVPNVIVQQIEGSRMARVRFTFEWRTTVKASSTSVLNRVREFVMQASFDIDDKGATTITKTGYLVMKRTDSIGTYDPPSFPSRAAMGTWDASGSPPGFTSGENRADFVPDYPGNDLAAANMPEEYRRLVAGNLPNGFRRISQRYITDETRCRLVFQVVDKEFFRKMASPARVGEATFEFERMFGEESQMVGLKRFAVELEGPNTVSVYALLALAVQMSHNRIMWSKQTKNGVTYQPDIIQRIKVAEPNILTRNAVRLEVDAIATSDAGTIGSVGVGTGTPYSSSLFLTDVMGALNIETLGKSGKGSGEGSPSGGTATFVFEEATSPDAFGEFGIYRITPSGTFFDPELQSGSLNWKTTTVITAANRENAVYKFPGQVVDDIIANRKVGMGVDAKKNRKQAATGADRAPYLRVKVSSKHSTDTGIVVAQSQSLQGADIDFQVRKPRAFITDVVEMVRLNEAPEKSMLPKRAGGKIVHQTDHVDPGVSDNVNNRLLGAVFVRVYQMADGGGSASNGFGTVGGIRQYAPYADGAGALENVVPQPKLVTQDTTDEATDPDFGFDLGTPEAWV